MSECLVNCNRYRNICIQQAEEQVVEKHLSEITYNLCMANLRDISIG